MLKNKEFVLSNDVIYVGGGNTRNLLALWKEWGLDIILREAYENGVVMGGISAGSLCWFEQGVTEMKKVKAGRGFWSWLMGSGWDTAGGNG